MIATGEFQAVAVTIRCEPGRFARRCLKSIAKDGAKLPLQNSDSSPAVFRLICVRMNRSIFFALWLCVGLYSSRAAETLPLAGEWRFSLDRSDAGVNEKWFAKNLADKIRLPGILQAQGFGEPLFIQARIGSVEGETPFAGQRQRFRSA